MKKSNTKYSIIDLETTGANSYGQKIIEIGIINFDGEEIEEIYTTLIHPEKNISERITMITGITNGMVEDAPKFYEVAKKIVEMTEGRVFVAHNVFFDYRFLQREFQDLGYSFKREVFCTCKTARITFKGLKSYSLQNLCVALNIPRERAHRALSDAKDCLAVFKLLGNKDKITSLRQDYDHLIPAQLKDFNFEDFPESPGLYFMKDEEDHLLYVGKSKNIRSRLKQHFKIFYGQKREQELKTRVTKVEFIQCYDMLPTDLLELHYIKKFRPEYNRASRRKVFRYGIVYHFSPNDLSPGDEIKVTRVIDDVPLIYTYGSRNAALKARERIYESVFGISPGSLNFDNQVKMLKKVLGENEYKRRLEKYYFSHDFYFEDTKVIKKNWTLTIENNRLTKIYVKGVGTISIDETPDMRSIILKYKNRIIKSNYDYSIRDLSVLD